MAQITSPETTEQCDAARSLFLEYADSLGFDLGFQQFDQEMARFPADYRPPNGTLLLAEVQGEAVGCVGVRRFDEESCEMKRLYVRVAYRGAGLGRLLAQAAVETGRELGYKRMRLDTLATMKEATALYRSMGFVPIEAYRDNPLPGASFMELALL